MTTTAPSLFDALEEGRTAAEACAEAASAEWVREAEYRIRLLPQGATFISEDIVLRLEGLGIATSDKRAMGGVIQRLRDEGVIVATGGARRAATSHGSYKPEWRRA